MKLEKLYLDQNNISDEAGRKLTKELHRRNRKFKFLHFTVRSKASLELRERQRAKMAASQGGDLGGMMDDDMSVQETLTQLIDKLKHHSAEIRKNTARSLFELIVSSEHQRGKSIEILQKQREVCQAELEEKEKGMHKAEAALEGSRSKFEAKQAEVQLLIDDNEFVSIKLIHEKQEREREMREAQQRYDLVTTAKEDAAKQVVKKDTEILALHAGNEVQLLAPDLGGVGALLQLLRPNNDGDVVMTQTMSVSLALRGVPLQQFKTNKSLQDSIRSFMSNDCNITKDEVVIDMESIQEMEQEVPASASAAAFSAFGGPTSMISFDVFISLEPGPILQHLKHRCAAKQAGEQ
jgi:hypothetical protein